MKAYRFGYKTVEQVVERVNDGAAQGFEEHTPEFLAASYAQQGQAESIDNGGNIDDGIRYDLEYLQLHGAKFDIDAAEKIAADLFREALGE